MSIKTSKRIALGVIAALVFAPFAAIAPASAVAGASTMSVPSVNGFVGQTITVPLTVLTNAATAATETATFTPTVSGTGLTVLTATPGGGAVIANTLQVAAAAGSIVIISTGASAGALNQVIGSFNFTASAPGAYTLTVTSSALVGYTGLPAVTARIFVSPAPGAAIQASTLADSINGTIYRVDTDLPTILITRPLGTSAPLALEVLSTPDVAEYPVGAVIRAGALQPANGGDTYTTVLTGFGTSFTAPAGGIDAQGLYQFKAFIDTNTNNRHDSGEESVDVSFRIVGIIDSATVSLDRSSIAAANSTIIATVALRDVNGFPTYGTPGDLAVSGLNAAGTAVAAFTNDVVITVAAGAGGQTATLNAVNDRVGTSNLYRASIAYTYDGAADPNAALGGSLRFTPSAGVTVAKNVFASVAVQDTEAAVATRLALTSQTGLSFGSGAARTTVIPADTTAANINAGNVAVNADPVVTSFNFTLTATAAKVYTVTTSPGSNMSGSRITSPSNVTTLADGSVTFTVTVTTPTVTLTTADSFTVNVGGTAAGNNFGYAVTYANPTAVWTLNPATAPQVLEKSTNKVTAKLTDSYGRVLGGTGYTVAVTGRNVSASTGVTDASGNAEFTLTDSATTSYALVGGFPTDTVTFQNIGTVARPAVAGPVTYTYKATLAAVGTVTVTVAADNKVIDQVEALAGAPVAGAIATYTATVRTAAGAAVGAGTLVTFAAGADDKFVDGITSGVTNASGQATANVYRQKVGFAAITATANTVVGAARAILWVNGGRPGDAGTTGDHRNVKVSAAQTVVPGSAATVVATVVDRWGNAVVGITVTFSLAGAGRVPTGETLTKRTDINGSAQVQVTSLATETGVNTVTATISGGQTLDLVGFVGAATFLNAAAIAIGESNGNAAPAAVAKGSHLRTAIAGNRTASGTVAFTAPVVVAPVVPTVVVPPVAPTLTAERQGNRVLLFGTCMVDEGDIIIYVKSPGKAYSEKAKTLECADGEYDGSLRASKDTKFYRVKQEGTGLYSTSRLIRP